MASRIGEILVARGLATAAQVEAALHDGRDRPAPLASRLLEAGVEEGGLAAALAERHGVPGVDLSRTSIELAALAPVPRAVAEQDLILPLSREGGRLHLAMAHPLDRRVVAEVRFVTGLEVSVYAAVRGALERAIAGAYDARDRGEAVWGGGGDGAVARLVTALPTPGPAPHAAVAPAAPDAPEEVGEDALLADEPPAPPAAAPGAEDEPAPVVIEVGEPEPLGPPRRPLALVVDDEPEIRRLVQRSLGARGWAVETAGDGEEAVARAEALRPDVVLLDAMLPRLHGFEACRRLRAAPRTRDVPVVMMTAVYRGWRFAQDARDHLGARDYVEKPFRIDDLVRRVEAARAERPATAPPPPPPPAAVARGRALLAAGQAREAAAVLREAVREDPWSADAHLELGRALRTAGDPFGAMTALERAAELRPSDLTALRALAALYEQKGFRRKAAETLERALAGGGARTPRAALRRDVMRLLG